MKTQVIVIHGGETFDSYEDYIKNLRRESFGLADLYRKSWKDTLSDKLGDDFEVIAPKMPNKQNAKYLEWKIRFDKIVPFIEHNVILIGHSIGGTFLAKYLSEEKLAKGIRGLFLVAPPFNDEDFSEDSLADFVLPEDLKNLENQAEKMFIYYSKDDPISPFAELSKFQKALPEAKTFIFEDKGHFLQEEFPEIVEEIKNLCRIAQ